MIGEAIDRDIQRQAMEALDEAMAEVEGWEEDWKDDDLKDKDSVSLSHEWDPATLEYSIKAGHLIIWSISLEGDPSPPDRPRGPPF